MYDTWDMTVSEIPERSELFCLEPIGIGTPYVESMTSYIIRLAEKHCILTGALTSEVIAPKLKLQYISNHFYKSNFDNKSDRSHVVL